MEWVDAVKEIKEAQENNRLVVFVGAGVSKNSNVPTWQELIEAIAVKIGYNRKTFLQNGKRVDSTSEDLNKHIFSQDELLRIPEYFYQEYSAGDHAEYYKFISETLYCENGPNPIDDEIFNIMPHHIITTNFDSLLEDSSVVNSTFYTVVSEDKGLLCRAEDRYLIKMHGDLKKSQSMVLKESDYITYEQKHPLISTFIRALLVNHTFLFLGYALNDYNLNLIIGWINYFCEVYGIEARPKNFLLHENSPGKFEETRLENKNIFVVDLSALPEELVAKEANATSLESPIGKKLFTFLRCIANPRILQRNMLLKDVLNDSFVVLRSYQLISLNDLKQVYSFGLCDVVGTTLSIKKQETYDKLVALLEVPDDSKEVRDVFNRTILTSIAYRLSETRFFLEPKTKDPYFRLYLDNNYKELEHQLDSCTDTAIKTYYYHFLGKAVDEIKSSLAMEEKLVVEKDFVAVLLHKVRSWWATVSLFEMQTQTAEEIKLLFDTAPVKYRPAVGHLKMLFESDAKDKHEMNKIVERQEEKYTFRSTKFYSEHDFKCVWDIQAYAYNYYFFIKKNGLPLDGSKMSDYLYYYIKVVLCSYAPTSAAEKDDSFFFSTYPLKRYPINEIDFDIIIKYIKPATLQALLEKYTVPMLETTEDFDICQKYVNLCASFPEYLKRSWRDHIYNFNIVLCFLKLGNDEKKALFEAFVKMLEQLATTKPDEISHLFEALYYFVFHFSLADADLLDQAMLSLLTEETVYSLIIKRYRDRFIRLLKKLSFFVTEEMQEKLMAFVESAADVNEKTDRIILFRYLLPKEKYKEFLTGNVSLLSTGSIFQLLVDEYIEYSDAVSRIFVDEIEGEVEKNKKNKNVKAYPEQLPFILEWYILLKLLGFDVDLTLFEPYKEYSEYLQFMLDPESFDYSLVDTGNYMWQNLIFDSTYKDYFKKHKPELLSEELNSIFARNVETRDQQKIVYGILLDEEELWGFGNEL